MIHSIESTVLAGDGCEPSAAVPPVSIEQLEDEITTLCAHLGAAEHRLLRAIGDFDARNGWVGIGIASCAHWLNWKCGISLVAAHDKVRVARALRSLPETAAAMSRGELSYSKVRALTRVATPENESALVTLAHQGTAAHVEEIVRRYRRVQRVDETAGAAQKQRARELRYRWERSGCECFSKSHLRTVRPQPTPRRCSVSSLTNQTSSTKSVARPTRAAPRLSRDGLPGRAHAANAVINHSPRDRAPLSPRGPLHSCAAMGRSTRTLFGVATTTHRAQFVASGSESHATR